LRPRAQLAANPELVRSTTRRSPSKVGGEDNRWFDLDSVCQDPGEEMMMADSDEVTGHTLRMAQERRLLRFCAEKGLDPNSPDLDNPDLNLLGPILDSDGAIVPDPEDIEAVK
jgi:hypothetical protein